jgi:hypothetical protein
MWSVVAVIWCKWRWDNLSLRCGSSWRQTERFPITRNNKRGFYASLCLVFFIKTLKETIILL